MNESIDSIKHKMVEEHEQTGEVDLERWLDESPDLPDELLEYATLLNLMGPDEDEDVRPEPSLWVDHGNVAKNAMRQAMEGLLEQGGHDPDLLLGYELSQAKENARPVPPHVSPATPAFRRAVVYTWTIDVLLRTRGEANRKGAQKITYLLERALELDLFTRHKREAAGVYDHEARYVDAEPISIGERGWLAYTDSETRFMAGPNLAAGLDYAERYIGDLYVAERFAVRLARLSDAELETWTTVDSCAVTLMNAGRPVTVEAVKQVLRGDKKWKHKLTQPNFTDTAIQEAIGHLVSLGLIPPEAADRRP
ncbi:MAG TPA: hypothetical protein VEQ60_15830 [Longimicrobium sp.]|nr:hypothetical protein [Longimicrobium sp.]